MNELKPRQAAPRWIHSNVVRNDSAFTLIELLVVISIIATLAGLVVGLAPTASERMKEARLRSELADLQNAIEGFHAKFGVYPPDGAKTLLQGGKEIDSSLSPLYYELSGVFVDNPNQVFITPDGSQRITSQAVQAGFGRDGFVNAALLGRRRAFSHRINDRQHAGIYRTANGSADVGLEVLAAGFITDSTGKKGSGFPWPTDAKTLNQYPSPIPSNPGLNPWHYISTTPTNNPGGYDLWAEYFVRGEHRVIANWKQ